MGATTLTEAQLRDKDYIIRYQSDLYMIGDHTTPNYPLGIAQYLNCSLKYSGIRNNFKLVKVIIKMEKIFVAKITASVVKVGEQLFTPYGRGLIIPKRVIRQPRPPSLVNTLVPHEVAAALAPNSTMVMSDSSDVELMPHTATIVPSF